MDFDSLRSGESHMGVRIESFRSELGDFRRYVYLIAGVHGDEVEGVFVLNKLFDYLKRSVDMVWPVIVFPILNVDGYRDGTRGNAHGVDLNRNLPADSWSSSYSEKRFNPGTKPLSEPENQYLIKVFNRYNPALIISFHSWKPMLNYNGPCQDLAEFLSSYNNYAVEGDVGYATPGSLGEFAPKYFNCPVLTYELPRLDDSGLSLQAIWEQNHIGLEKLFSSDFLRRYLQ